MIDPRLNMSRMVKTIHGYIHSIYHAASEPGSRTRIRPCRTCRFDVNAVLESWPLNPFRPLTRTCRLDVNAALELSLKKYGFDVVAYAKINNMNEVQFREYCNAKMSKYEKDRK